MVDFFYVLRWILVVFRVRYFIIYTGYEGDNFFILECLENLLKII